MLQARLSSQVRGSRPRIKLMQAKADRHEQNQHQGQHHESCLEKSSSGIAPASAGKLVKHGDCEATERQTEPIKKSEQVREEKLPAIQERAHSRGDQCDDGDEPQEALNSI